MTLPKLRRRDYRQNPQRVAPWQKEILPELKKTAEPEQRGIFSGDENACYLLPPIRRTWAPVGQTPILTAGCQYTHLSAMSAISEGSSAMWVISTEAGIFQSNALTPGPSPRGRGENGVTCPPLSPWERGRG